MKHEKRTEMVMCLFWGIFLKSLMCFNESRTLSMFLSAGSSALTSMWSFSSFVFMSCKSSCILWRFNGSRSLCSIKSALRTRLCRFEGGIWDDIENVLVEEMEGRLKFDFPLLINSMHGQHEAGDTSHTTAHRWVLGAYRLSIIRYPQHLFLVSGCAFCLYIACPWFDSNRERISSSFVHSQNLFFGLRPLNKFLLAALNLLMIFQTLLVPCR